VEEGIRMIFDSNIVGLFSEEEFNSLKVLEGSKKYILAKEKIEWRLKANPFGCQRVI